MNTNYIDIPNIPKNNAAKVLLDYRTPYKIVSALKKYGIIPVFTKKAAFLYDEINGHPDIIIHHLEKNIFAAAPFAYNYFKEKLPSSICIQGSACLSCNYPEDIAYNIARIGNLAFHNLKYTDKNIREYYERIGVKLINVRQGYSKCNICIVSDKAIITSDISIAKQADLYNLDVLLISHGSILLGGLNYGFIGGVSGLISPDNLAFAGDISMHPDYEKITDFCDKYGVDAVSLSDDKLVDIGSIIPITEYSLL